MTLESFSKLLSISNISWLIFCVLIFFTLCMYKQFLMHKRVIYDGYQRVHEGEIPRLGGFAIFLSMIILNFILEAGTYKETLQKTLICLLPIFLIVLKEDVYHNTGIGLR